MLYCEPRFTKDLDVWVEASEDSAARVYAALREFGAPLRGLSPADFVEAGTFYQIGVPPVRVDILTSIDGVEFNAAWTNRVCRKFGNLTANFISRRDMIQNKRTSGRLQDLADVESLLLGTDEGAEEGSGAG